MTSHIHFPLPPWVHFPVAHPRFHPTMNFKRAELEPAQLVCSQLVYLHLPGLAALPETDTCDCGLETECNFMHRFLSYRRR